MRYSLSTNFAFALGRHGDAYAAHDRFASAGDDGVRFGGTAEADAASEAEHQALDEVLLTPCRHPGDVAAKLKLIEERDVLGRDDGSRIMASIVRDLRWLSRPGASSAMEVAWAKWAACHAAYLVPGLDEPSLDAVCDNHSAAFRELMLVPCTTAGDFVVKSYVELLAELGSCENQPGGYHFEVSPPHRMPDTHYLSDDAREGMINDISECDLGRCMMMLGSLDFDASAWVRAAERCGLNFGLINNVDGSRSFYLGELSGSGASKPNLRRHSMLRALLAFDTERSSDVADEIELYYSHHVLRPAVAATSEREAA